MARYANVITSDKSAQEILTAGEDFLASKGFKKKEKGGEEVWMKGGILAAPQFVKLAAEDGRANIESWIKFAWLPGVYSGEMDLEGSMGFAIKKMLKKVIAGLEEVLK